MRIPHSPPSLFVVALVLISMTPATPRAHDDAASALAVLGDSARASGTPAARARAAAEFLRADGRLSEAEAALRVAEQLEPVAFETRVARAALALDTGDPRRALAALDLALAERPEAVAARWLRARARRGLGDDRGALADFDLALATTHRPTPERHAERAEVALAIGDSSGALARLDAAAARLRAPWLVERARTLREVLGSRAAPRVTPSTGPGPAVAVAEPAAPDAAVIVRRTRGPYLQQLTGERVVVRWRTDVPTAGWVGIGPECGAWTRELSDPAVTTEHEVVVDGLAPATLYAYAVGSPETTLTTCAEGCTFRTAPVVGSEVPTRLWVIGDSGSNSTLGSAVRDAWHAWSVGHPADLWLMLGDNAYGAGLDAEYQSGLFNQYPVMLRTTPLWPTRGNHDILYAGPANDYYDHFTLPTLGEAGGVPSGTEAYYAFDWADIHLVCLDSEGTSALPGSPMLAWLRADLAANTQPWVIAYWHHPPYTKGSHDSDNAADSGGRMRDMRQHVLPVLDSLGVDLVLTGHSHSYERSCLLAGHYGISTTLVPAMRLDPGDGRPDGDGAYHKAEVAPGVPGGTVYAVNGSAAQASGGALNHPAMITSLNVGGSMVLDVHGPRLEARFLDAAGVVRDSFVIERGTTGVAAGGRAAGLALAPPAPQPSLGPVRLAFTLARPAAVRLAIVDTQGRAIATLVQGALEGGRHALYWDGRDARGHRVRAGVYHAVLTSAGERRAVRLVRLD